MSDVHNHGKVNNQINNPIVHGDIKFINYGERKIKRYLTALPSLKEEVIGREEDLQQLHTALQEASQVVLMNGMGGIGKTTLAIKYLNHYKANYHHIVWLEQLSDFASDIVTDPLLLRNLDIQPTANTVADAQILLNELANLQGPSLFVIDNADTQIHAFKQFLPKAPNWQVLITSRQSLSFAKKIELDFLSEKDALRLFYTHYTLDKDDEAAKQILYNIDYHTLTLEILAKTAQKRKISSVKAIVDLLEERGIAIQRKVGLSVTHSKEVKIERLFPYLQAIFDLGDIKEQAGKIHLLQQFVGLPPTFIPFDLLTKL